MPRTIPCLLTALFTFLAGVSLYSTHTVIVEWLRGEADDHQLLIEPLAFEDQASEIPLRIGIFIGVDAVTFSSDNSKFDLFDDYRSRETPILISSGELSEIVHQLMSAGLLTEQTCTPSFISLPVNHTIIVAWPNAVRAFTWIRGDDCRVPEKYLTVFEEVNSRHHASLLEKFITSNRL
jgi:hypothetical protein